MQSLIAINIIITSKISMCKIVISLASFALNKHTLHFSSFSLFVGVCNTTSVLAGVCLVSCI